jgi:uncharacterized membrane protein YdfJ with MMPL/SSD domain
MLLAGQLEFFRAFGPGLALTVLVTLAIALTFIPATLAILGRSLFWPSLPVQGKPSAAQVERAGDASSSGEVSPGSRRPSRSPS